MRKELGYGLGFLKLGRTHNNEGEGARTTNGVDRVQARSRLRIELDFVRRFPLFRGFLPRSGMLMFLSDDVEAHVAHCRMASTILTYRYPIFSFPFSLVSFFLGMFMND